MIIKVKYVWSQLSDFACFDWCLKSSSGLPLDSSIWYLHQLFFQCAAKLIIDQIDQDGPHSLKVLCQPGQLPENYCMTSINKMCQKKQLLSVLSTKNTPNVYHSVLFLNSNHIPPAPPALVAVKKLKFFITIEIKKWSKRSFLFCFHLLLPLVALSQPVGIKISNWSSPTPYPLIGGQTTKTNFMCNISSSSRQKWTFWSCNLCY